MDTSGSRIHAKYPLTHVKTQVMPEFDALYPFLGVEIFSHV